MTSRFGRRSSGTHTGIDIALPSGTSIVAADGGKVTFAGWSGGYGLHRQDLPWQQYADLVRSLQRASGQRRPGSAKGQPIARVGSTGTVRDLICILK